MASLSVGDIFNYGDTPMMVWRISQGVREELADKTSEDVETLNSLTVLYQSKFIEPYEPGDVIEITYESVHLVSPDWKPNEHGGFEQPYLTIYTKYIVKVTKHVRSEPEGTSATGESSGEQSSATEAHRRGAEDQPSDRESDPSSSSTGEVGDGPPGGDGQEG